jgi:mRNA interferase RelE/StbE
MYTLKLHDKVYDDLKDLDKAIVVKVFKKLKQIQQSP